MKKPTPFGPKIKKIYKSQAGNNSISNSGDRNKISQRNVKKGDR